MKETTSFNEAASSSLETIMTAVQAGLPAGICTTNKKPVQKEIRFIGSAVADILWTSWCKDANGERFLAVLQKSGRVKLISSEQLSKYKLRSVK